MKDYVPDKGDIVWLDFTPQAGHEQRGKRPAIALSLKSYNEKTRLALFCPITTKIKDYPFEVRIKTEDIDGVILSDQVKSLDWSVRHAEYIGIADDAVTSRAIENIKLLFG
jgi:mRNA interferase MazF